LPTNARGRLAKHGYRKSDKSNLLDMGLLDMELSVISRIVVTALSISFTRNK
jgi:hypothetical protein